MMRRKSFLGLLRRREILVPTWLGWLFLILIAIGGCIGAERGVYPFLATSRPVSGGVLVAEGWIPRHLFKQVVDEFRRNKYDRLYVTGGPIEDDMHCSGPTTYAEAGADAARRHGLTEDDVQAVPTAKVDRDRTYASAIALRNWLSAHSIEPKQFQVVTLGAHARRTHLLFEKALGASAVVGVTAIEDPTYDASHWWRSSIGVRLIIEEGIAYLYAKLIFVPKL